MPGYLSPVLRVLLNCSATACETGAIGHVSAARNVCLKAESVVMARKGMTSHLRRVRQQPRRSETRLVRSLLTSGKP